MNRSEFVAAVAERGGMTQTDADKALNAIFDEIEAVVKKGEKLAIPGWVTVSTSPRAARTGRNPQTGEPVQIAATTVVKLAPGSKLKAAAKS